ncbi:hypothetical protein [Micromonospora sp. WMMD980]|uniref:hypothetical protein n=1 Tax=Micromonospora sp. WMMD980 TaxID=3016088 RepID=UPI0024163BC7|nr:hypothetical protein [Micromonospora sp. WMMD980]MDG4803998.1 hypothetical protein [Micromonospora sp. WMMD980]
MSYGESRVAVTEAVRVPLASGLPALRQQEVSETRNNGRGLPSAGGVTRNSLGYQANGTTVRAFDGARQEQINLVLDRERWESHRDDIAIHGLGDEVLELMDVKRATPR